MIELWLRAASGQSRDGVSNAIGKLFVTKIYFLKSFAYVGRQFDTFMKKDFGKIK